MPLGPKFHAGRRAALSARLGDDAVAIIDTADVLALPGDFEYPYRPGADFYYLTGIAEPEAVLVLVPGNSQAPGRELLFISGTSDFVGTWLGSRLTPEEAADLSGIQTVLPTSDLDRHLDRLLSKYHTVYLNADETAALSHMPSPAKRRAQHLRRTAPLHHLRSAAPLVDGLRMIKDPVEVTALREAIAHTAAGLAAARRSLKPGRHEHEVEAELTAEFVRRGSGHAFTPIIASGPSTTTIHHTSGRRRIAEDSVVLLDVGAESAFYAADISRTLPSGRRFTKRARDIYRSVLKVQEAAIGELKPGVDKRKYEEAVGEWLLEELVTLGVIPAMHAKGKAGNRLLRQYYPHGASHFLGLGLHDAGDYTVPLQAGMVLTVEPGIYLKDEGIGVRIEDDILITEEGNELLSRDIPKQLDEIEEEA